MKFSVSHERILQFYICAVVFIWIYPNYGAADIIGSQWLYLSILNFIGLGLILLKRKSSPFLPLLKNPILICLGLLCLWALGSLGYANNTAEVLIETSRLCSLFLLLINFSAALIVQKNRIHFVSTILVVLLGIEILMVLGQTYLTVGTFKGISRGLISKGIAANINITSFSILYKVPFLFYFFTKSKLILHKGFYLLFVFLAFFTITLSGTRGALLASVTIVVFNILISFFSQRNRMITLRAAIFLIPLVFAFLLNQLLQRGTNLGVSSRLSTISNLQNDGSTNQRFSYYQLSLDSFFDSPLIGMGFGNWKIESIPYTLDNRTTYIVPYHSHNDFLQMAAELGILGLLFYVGIFGFSLYFIIYLFKSKNIDSSFLITLLLFFIIYLIDANLNFPISRLIIQIPFLLILAFIIIEYSKAKQNILPSKSIFIIYALIFISPLLIYSNYRVFKSFQQQDKLLRDLNSLNFSGDIDEINKFEMDYPNIGVTALPLKAMIANYSSVSDPDKAIELALASIKDNPYLYFSEMLVSQFYLQKNDLINSKKYAKLAYENAPSIEVHAAFYLPYLKEEKNVGELERISNLLKRSKSKYVWELYFNSLFASKSKLTTFDKELLMIGIDRFPEFKRLLDYSKMKNYSKYQLQDAQQIANRADIYFQQKEFDKAIEKYKEAAKLIPEEKAYVENIARGYMLREDYENAIVYFQKLIDTFNESTGMSEYYIAALLFKQGDKKASCETLLTSIDKGFLQAKTLYNNICLSN